MKRSIKHLPKCTQEELNFLQDLIIRKIADNCMMIILYGSYARGNYVLWDEKVEFGVHTSYQSDLDILIVTPKQNIRTVENIVRGKIIPQYHRAFAHRRHASPQIIVEYISSLNEQLEMKQYFFTDIVREGIKLYDTKAIALAKPRKLSFKEIKGIATREFNQNFSFGNELLDKINISLNKGAYVVDSFLAHQVCERFYYSISLVYTNYRPKNHRLPELSAMVKSYSRELSTVFPQNTDFEKHCYDLLCRAYIEARYNKDFVVTKEELEYMLRRIELFKDITSKICMDKIESYNDLIREEEQNS